MGASRAFRTTNACREAWDTDRKEGSSCMRALRIVAEIIVPLAALQAQGTDQVRDFSLKYFSAETAITLHAALTYDGKGERLVATATNESGARRFAYIPPP